MAKLVLKSGDKGGAAAPLILKGFARRISAPLFYAALALYPYLIYVAFRHRGGLTPRPVNFNEIDQPEDSSRTAQKILSIDRTNFASNGVNDEHKRWTHAADEYGSTKPEAATLHAAAKTVVTKNDEDTGLLGSERSRHGSADNSGDFLESEDEGGRKNVEKWHGESHGEKQAKPKRIGGGRIIQGVMRKGLKGRLKPAIGAKTRWWGGGK